MAVGHQDRHAVPTAAGAEKRSQLEFMRVINDAFSQLIRDALHGFVDIRHVGCGQ